MSLDVSIERYGDGYRLVYDVVYLTEPGDLWRAITQPERLGAWMAQYSGDLNPGGVWRAADKAGADPWVRGTVSVCDPPHSFATTWHAQDEGPTQLMVRLVTTEGGTRLVLDHSGIPSIFYGAGWQTYLEQLDAYLAGRDLPDWAARYAELAPLYEARFAELRE